MKLHRLSLAQSSQNLILNRVKYLVILFGLALLSILIRLFYWQIWTGGELRQQAMSQYSKNIVRRGLRGSIYTHDNYPLAFSLPAYNLVADPTRVENKTELAGYLTDWLTSQASDSSPLATAPAELNNWLNQKLTTQSRRVLLAEKLSQDVKELLAQKRLAGLSFEETQDRVYPESSMAAHVLGFVGQDENGQPTGYFGVEGGLDRELKGRVQKKSILADALGLEIRTRPEPQPKLDGRYIQLTIRRDVQYTIDTMLRSAIDQYQAKSGEVIVMEPSTGNILGLANWPSFDPNHYQAYEQGVYKNQSVSAGYEPGSTFKIITLSAGIDSGTVTPDTQCPACSGPRLIDKYTIRTWNDVYHPNITMAEALAKSDNTAMIFVAQKMGEPTFRTYLNKFMIGQPIGLELQEDTATPFPKTFGPVELATASFGQGISTTSLQLVRAVGAIANRGLMMQPRLVAGYADDNTSPLQPVPTKALNQVISANTAQTMTELMVGSALHGEAQWTVSRTHQVAGKTGTSQIASQGGYDETKTIASFIGFAPPDNPRFIMLVKLVEPQTSPWAAETAAPLWYKIADRLYLLLDMPPDVN